MSEDDKPKRETGEGSTWPGTINFVALCITVVLVVWILWG